MVKTGVKKVAALVVTSPNRAVKMVERVSRFQRGSCHFPESLTMTDVWLKTKDIGKLESKPTLLTPFRVTAP
jgi:hypothetical protein